MARKSLSELIDDKSEKINKGSLPALILKSRTDAHITHLLNKDKTLATHKALESYYEDITDLVDNFIETSLVWYPLNDITPDKSGVIVNPVEYFKSLYTEVNTIRIQYKESFLQNIIDEIQTLISQTIYRLTFITT